MLMQLLFTFYIFFNFASTTTTVSFLNGPPIAISIARQGKPIDTIYLMDDSSIVNNKKTIYFLGQYNNGKAVFVDESNKQIELSENEIKAGIDAHPPTTSINGNVFFFSKGASAVYNHVASGYSADHPHEITIGKMGSSGDWGENKQVIKKGSTHIMFGVLGKGEFETKLLYKGYNPQQIWGPAELTFEDDRNRKYTVNINEFRNMVLNNQIHVVPSTGNSAYKQYLNELQDEAYNLEYDVIKINKEMERLLNNQQGINKKHKIKKKRFRYYN